MTSGRRCIEGLSMRNLFFDRLSRKQKALKRQPRIGARQFSGQLSRGATPTSRYLVQIFAIGSGRFVKLVEYGRAFGEVEAMECAHSPMVANRYLKSNSESLVSALVANCYSLSGDKLVEPPI